jgi:hypothetical protein
VAQPAPDKLAPDFCLGFFSSLLDKTGEPKPRREGTQVLSLGAVAVGSLPRATVAALFALSGGRDFRGRRIVSIRQVVCLPR